jgi:hypothetical protein
MQRRIAVVGDTLTGGGFVLSYRSEMDFMFHGHQVALIGGKAYCEKCKSTGIVVKAGGPTRLNYINMREVALDRDIVLCECERHPQIIAVHAGDSMVDDEAEKYAALTSAPSAGSSTSSNAYRYDQHFILRDERTGRILANTPYRIVTDDGGTTEGRTDVQGRTDKVSSDSAAMATVYVLEDHAPMNPDWDRYL